MADWGDRQTRALSDDVSRFLAGLDRYPALRRRLETRGYLPQHHRELQACLARVTRPGGLSRREPTPDEPPGAVERVRGSTRAVLGWAAQQARLAAAAAQKIPAVAREIQRVAQQASAGPPMDTARATWRVVERIRGDEHLGHFFTAGGLRDAGVELRHRLREDGSPTARDSRTQAHAELSFLYTRWRQAALEEFAGETALLARLGIE